MDSDPASRAPRKHTNGWMTVLALGLLAVGLLACLYILVGFPAEAQAVNGSTVERPTPASSSPAPSHSAASRWRVTPRRLQLRLPAQAPVAPSPHPDPTSAEMQAELNTVHDQLRQSQENLAASSPAQRRIRTASALFLAVFAVIAALIVIQVYQQARAWDRDASRAVAEVEAVAAQLDVRARCQGAKPGTLCPHCCRKWVSSP